MTNAKLYQGFLDEKKVEEHWSRLLFVEHEQANVPSTPLGYKCKDFMVFPSTVVSLAT